MKKIRFLEHGGNSSLNWKRAIFCKIKNSIKYNIKNILLFPLFNYGGAAEYSNINNIENVSNKNEINLTINQGELLESKLNEFKDIENSEEITETKNEVFGGITLSPNGKYEVPGIANSPKSIKNREFPNVKFGNCRLSKGLGRVVYEKALVGGGRRETHQETYYSQRVLRGGGLDIPGRHVAQDGTVRDGEGFIAVAAPLNVYPKGTKIMTTLGPGKVYDTGHMKGKSIDIYVNW